MNEAASSDAVECRVTVIVTFYNQGQWVSDALDSVSAQTESGMQVLITDDGSDDDTHEQITSWKAKHAHDALVVASDRNVGLPAMLNRAASHIAGDCVIILNGDDWMYADRARRQADALASLPPNVGVVYSDIREVDANRTPTGRLLPQEGATRLGSEALLPLIAEQNLIGMGMVMFRRSVLDEIGLWDEHLMADDFDFLLRTAAAGFDFSYLPGAVLDFRRYEGSMTNSSNQGQLALGRAETLAKLLGRDHITDQAILTRMTELSLALHSVGWNRPLVRKYLRMSVLRQPSRRGIRALIESHIGVRAGRLSPRYWMKRGRPPV